MHPEVGLVTAAIGAAATPLVLAAVRWAPGVRRLAPVDEVTAAAPVGEAPAATPMGEVAAAAQVTGAALAPAVSGVRSVVRTAVLCAVVLGLLGGALGADAALPAYLLFGVIAVTLSLIDLALHRLPDVLTLPSYAIGVALLGGAAVAGSSSGSLARAAAGAVIGFLAFAVLFLVARSGIGAGDVKYAGVVGLHAGWLGWGPLVVALVGGFVLGAAASVVLLLTGRAGLKTALPFGPAMAAAAVVAIVWGNTMTDAWFP